VLAVTEWLGEPKLATLDHRHFGTMRPRHVEALKLLSAAFPESQAIIPTDDRNSGFAGPLRPVSRVMMTEDAKFALGF
jgi:hypothetical protein